MTTQIACPEPTALLPGSGPAAGGNVVQISGTGFTGATRVMFGNTPAKSITVASNSLIEAVAPPGSGTVMVSVITPGGTVSSPSLAKYAYLAVRSVTPRSGPARGGTSVTITGAGLGDVQAVFRRTTYP